MYIKYVLFAGIDKLLAQHIAHLFIRDPLSVFEEKIHLDDENESDHFEVTIFKTSFREANLLPQTEHRSKLSLRSFFIQNLQSTNWQTMRFKPPPPNSNIGWRVEFRPMEVFAI